MGRAEGDGSEESHLQALGSHSFDGALAILAAIPKATTTILASSTDKASHFTSSFEIFSYFLISFQLCSSSHWI